MPIQTDIAQFLSVLPDQRALAGRQIDTIEIMPSRVAVIDLGSHVARGVLGPQCGHDADIFEWRNVAHNLRCGIDDEKMVVLVPVFVVEKHQETAVHGHSCQLIGRPLVRVTGIPDLMSSASDSHTFKTPSTGASHEIQRPSGEIFAPKKVGLSNNVWRGMSGFAARVI
jgi:hypothetical protein